ncbi:MAG: YqjD family protein [Acidobacteriota bacterium]
MPTKTSKPPTSEADDGSRTAASRLRDHTKAVGDDLRTLGHLAKDAAQEKLEEARQAASGYYDEGVEKATDLEGQLVKYVRDKPLKSVLIAAGAGILVGILWGRR